LTGDNELILAIVTSIVDMTGLSNVYAAIASQPDPSRKVEDLLGCLQDLQADGGPYALMLLQSSITILLQDG
jgi:hypothetical protein